MKEKSFQTTFNKWVKNVYKKTAAFELKQTKTNSLSFDAVVPHQIEALQNANSGAFVYKIVDCGYQNPFDSFCLYQVPAFVVIKYPKSTELIPIDNFIYEKSKSKRKSLTSERARAISTITINI